MNDTYWNDPANLALIIYDRLCTQCMRAIDQANVISYANGSKGTGEYSGKYYFPTLENMRRGKFSSKKVQIFAIFGFKK